MRKRMLLLGCLLTLLTVLDPGDAAAQIQGTTFPGTVLIRPEGVPDGEDTGRVWCARGETESLQVAITSASGNLEKVTVGVSPLKHEDGAELPADCVTLFREVLVPIRHSSPHATRAPGLVPDPLAPFVHPYTGEPIKPPRWTGKDVSGARFGGATFDVWEGRCEAVWLDIRVPADAAAGVYRGAVTVRAPDVDPVDIPLEVTVWDFTLPPGPTHENHFGGFTRVAGYLGLERGSEVWHTVEDRYCAMMAAHRLNPPIPHRLHPARQEDGSVVFDEDLDSRLTAFVEEHHLTNVEVPRTPFGVADENARAKTINYYRSWFTYLERRGWAERAYIYMLDEPNDADAYERVRQLGAAAKEGAPQLRRLVVEQPYTQKPTWGFLDGAIDIWCPLFGFVHEESIKRVQAQGDDVWSYTALCQRAPAYHPAYEEVKGLHPPYWQMDFPLTSYRIAPWLNRRYGITGLLYWSTVCWSSPRRNPWHDPGFRVRYNGEGSFFYPGDELGIDGPVASIRLKNLRDGMEDFEYFALLEKRGGRAAVEEIVRAAVPTWSTWDQDPYALLKLRQRLAEEILRRTVE